MPIDEQSVESVEIVEDVQAKELVEPAFEVENDLNKNEIVESEDIDSLLRTKNKVKHAVREKIKELQIWLFKRDMPGEASIEVNDAAAIEFVEGLELVREEIFSSPDYYKKATIFLADIEAVKKFYDTQNESLSSDIEVFQLQIKTINHELGGIGKQNLLLRSVMFLKLKSLNQKKADLEDKVKKAAKTLGANNEKKGRLEYFKEDVSYLKQQKNAKEKVEKCQEVDDSVKTEFELLDTELVKDQDFITDSFRSSVKNYILRDNLILGGLLKENEAGEYINKNYWEAAKNELANKVIVWLDDNDLVVIQIPEGLSFYEELSHEDRVEFEKCFARIGNEVRVYSYNVKNEASNFRTGAAKTLISQMVSNEFSKMGNLNVAGFLSHSFVRRSDDSSKRFHRHDIQRIKMWGEAKKSELFHECFKKEIKGVDDNISAYLIKESLEDSEGSLIDCLEYFPTPESIRNLVLLATADNYKEYSQIHAIGGLQELFKDARWPDIKLVAEKAYPTLNLENVEKELNGEKDFRGLPKSKPKFDAYAAEIFKASASEQVGNNPLREVALRAMSLGGLAEVAVENKLLNNEQVLLINEADEVIKTNQNVGVSDYMKKKLIFYLSNSDEEKEKTDNLALLEQLMLYAKTIIQFKDNEDATCYLKSSTLISTFENMKNGENASMLLAAPSQLDNIAYILHRLPNKHFYKNFAGQKTINDYKKLGEVYENHTELLGSIFDLIEADKITIQRAIELPGVASDIFQNEQALNLCLLVPEVTLIDDRALAMFRKFLQEYEQFDFMLQKAVLELVRFQKISMERAIELGKLAETEFLSQGTSLDSELFAFSQLTLASNAGLDFIREKNKKGIGSIDRQLDQDFGKCISEIKNIESPAFVNRFVLELFNSEINKFKAENSQAKNSPIDTNNWLSKLMVFTRTTLEGFAVNKLTIQEENKIKETFEGSKVKQLCLNELRSMWQRYLESGEQSEVPAMLQLIGRFVDEYGSGPLSQFESQAGFINTYIEATEKPTTAPKTKQGIYAGLAEIEQRFSQDKWSNDDRTNFYNITKEILVSSPALLTDYLKLFETLDPDELENFAEELLSLYRAKLVLLERPNQKNSAKHNPRQLIEIRRDLRGLAEKYQAKTNTVEIISAEKKQELIIEITELFKNRFGIIKIPEVFTDEVIHSLVNSTNYLANLNERDEDKENILGYYLATIINNKWQALRRNEEVNPRELLVPAKAKQTEEFIKKRSEQNPITSTRLKIEAEQLPDFMIELQQESQSQALGTVMTIDVKLSNVIANLAGLSDENLFNETMDKERIKILSQYGKKVSVVASKLHQQLVNESKLMDWTEEELQIKQEIESVLSSEQLAVTPSTINQYFQNGLKSFAVVTNLLDKLKTLNASKEIEALKQLLIPGEQVALIFNRLGEGFKSDSGAVADLRDVEYLKSLANKNKTKLTAEELVLINKYIEQVGDQLVVLQKVYDKVVELSGTLDATSKSTNNDLLKAKLTEIKEIIERRDDQQMIVSTMTNNLDTVIENIRECLSCVRQGCNNDTNLTFGDSNKFFILSQSDLKQKGSISDQIVYFEPITDDGGNLRLGFVLDAVYGHRTPDVLMNHLATVYKKCQSLKQKFPAAELSIVIPRAVVNGVSVDQELFIKRLKEKFGKVLDCETKNVAINLVESAAGDHYQEFSQGGARTAGKREVEGVIIAF